MRPIYVTNSQIAETLTYLQEAGRRNCECVVLWLGKDEVDCVRITHAYRPEQMAQADIFRIHRPAMNALMEILSSQELMIAAQIHSHPYEAFHSRADDQWAIVRHVDALSLVVPDFCLKTTPGTFFQHMKAYQLSSANRWHELSTFEAQQWLKVQ